MALRFKLPRLDRFKAPASGSERPLTRYWQQWVGRLPLSPRWLIARTSDGRYHTYRIDYRWDGERRFYPYPEFPREPAYLVLDKDVPYRRKLQRYPQSKQSCQALLRTAPDEFPLPPDTVDYALGLWNGDGYLYALPKAEWSDLAKQGVQLAAIILADQNPATVEQCEIALKTFEKHGSVQAFGPTQRRLPRTLVRNGLLSITGAVGFALVTWLALTPNLFGDLLRWQSAGLRAEMGDLPVVYQAVNDMQSAQQGLQTLRQLPTSQFSPLLAKLLATQPTDAVLRIVSIEENRLTLTGMGNDVQVWLEGAGFPAENIQIQQMGSITKFTAERNL